MRDRRRPPPGPLSRCRFELPTPACTLRNTLIAVSPAQVQICKQLFWRSTFSSVTSLESWACATSQHIVQQFPLACCLHHCVSFHHQPVHWYVACITALFPATCIAVSVGNVLIRESSEGVTCYQTGSVVVSRSSANSSGGTCPAI